MNGSPGKLSWLCCVVVALSACAHRPTAKARETARISYDVGIAAFQRGDAREALRALLAAVKADPSLPEPYNALGLVYHANDKRELALLSYEKALALRPLFSEARNNCGVLLLDMGRYDQAILAFEKTLTDMLYASPVLAEGNLGWALYQKGEVQAGKEHLLAAVASDAKFCRGYQWLMRIATELDDAPQALEIAERCYRHCSRDAALVHPVSKDFRRDIEHMAALAHLRLGHDQQALALLHRCAGAPDEECNKDSAQARCRASLATLGG